MMADQRFAACLFRELQRYDDERQRMLDTWELLSEERGTIRRRIELLRELLTLEGIDLNLPNTLH